MVTAPEYRRLGGDVWPQQIKAHTSYKKTLTLLTIKHFSFRMRLIFSLYPSLFAIELPSQFGDLISFAIITVLAGCTVTAMIKIGNGRLSGFRQVTPQIAYPIVDSQKYEFTATVEEGQALAFGGLTGLSNSSDDTRVPLLGKLPLLGGLFRHTDKKGEQQNLIGYIIPTIVRETLLAAPPIELKSEHAGL
jgi:hypothetical protein